MNLGKCDLCPRNCRVNRTKNKFGYCKTGNDIQIAWYGKHFGEEPSISGPSRPKGGRGGSGTIFFSGCNLSCVYCQNWQISQGRQGEKKNKMDKVYKSDEVVKIILNLQKQGVKNINLVSPTIWAYQLKQILIEAKKRGLIIPVIWNSNGYEDVGIIREIGPASPATCVDAGAKRGESIGVVDVFLPDYKYSDNKLAEKYSFAPNYSEIAQEAILEMYRQVGDFREKTKGPEGQEEKRRTRGLIIRHLILPGQIKNTINCLKFIRSISPNIHLSLMTQYNPVYKSKDYPEINRRLTREEYQRVLGVMRDLKFNNGWIQEFDESVECFTPDFEKENPFE